MGAFTRVENLIGGENLKKLSTSSVAVFGVGGVGSFVAEALVRSGIGKIAIFDGDVVDETNLNRQLIATKDTIGMDKVEAVKKRLTDINENLDITIQKIFYLKENADQIDLSQFDYVVDAVDTVSAKIELILRANKKGVPIISCMGTGGKLQMEELKVADIYQTSGCPLARVMRRELKKHGVEKLKVIYSKEGVVNSQTDAQKADGRTAPPSMIFVPATAGLYIAREVVLDLIKTKER